MEYTDLGKSRTQRKIRRLYSSTYEKGHNVGYWRSGLSNIKLKKLFRFLDSHTSRDTCLLRKFNNYTTMEDCAFYKNGVCVSDNYVRVAAYMYTFAWKNFIKDRSYRVMLDPTFSVCVMQGDPKIECYINHIINMPCISIHVVFVPVIQEGHWWCAVYSVNSKEIWVIDSLSTKYAASEHKESLDKLCYGMNNMFKILPGTEQISIDTLKWERIPVDMEQQTDGTSCGVRMLATIKVCATRFESNLKLGSIEKVRQLLFAPHA